MEPVTAMLIGSGISAASGIATNWMNRKNVQNTNEQRERMFERQLQYNTESSQMVRRMAAGLHPMTMAGSQPSEAPTAPDFESFEARNPFSAVSDVGISATQSALEQQRLKLQGETIEVQKLNTFVDFLNSISSLAGQNYTTEEIFGLAKKVGLDFGDAADTKAFRDTFVLHKLTNDLAISNLSKEEKEITVKWLDKLKNLEAQELQGNVDLQQIEKRVKNSVADLNEEKRREVEQGILNLQKQIEQMDSIIALNKSQKTFTDTQNTAKQYDANLSSARLKNVKSDAEALALTLSSEAGVSEKDAELYVLKLILSTISSVAPNVGFVGKL